MTLGQRIKSIRIGNGLTQDEFGARIGIGKSSISSMESDKSNPSDQTIRSICREFGVNEEYLRTGEGDIFVTRPGSQILEGELRAFLGAERCTDFAERLIRVLIRVPPSYWTIIERYARRLVEDTEPEEGETESPPD